MSGLIFYNADGSESMRLENIVEVPEDHIVVDFDVPDEEGNMTKALHIPMEGELIFNGHINTKVVLPLLTGMKITNNWLKLHGGVMERKSYKKYGKKKIKIEENKAKD